MTGAGGSVTAIDVWERVEAGADAGAGSASGAAAPASSSSSSSSWFDFGSTETNYVVAAGGAAGWLRVWSVRWRLFRGGAASGSAVELVTKQGG